MSYMGSALEEGAQTRGSVNGGDLENARLLWRVLEVVCLGVDWCRLGGVQVVIGI